VRGLRTLAPDRLPPAAEEGGPAPSFLLARQPPPGWGAGRQGCRMQLGNQEISLVCTDFPR